MAKPTYVPKQKPQVEDESEIEELVYVDDPDLEPEFEEPVYAENVAEEVEDRSYAKVIDCRQLNVRESPEKASAVLFVVPVGTVFIVDSKDKTWSAVHTASGDIYGFVMTDFLQEL